MFKKLKSKVKGAEFWQNTNSKAKKHYIVLDKMTDYPGKKYKHKYRVEVLTNYLSKMHKYTRYFKTKNNALKYVDKLKK